MLRLLLVLSCATPLPAWQEPGPERPDPARAFFASGDVLRVAITLSPSDRQKLRENAREYVPATVTLGDGTVWERVGVKLKGAAGSFREIDDQPGFTVHLGKFGGDARLHGLQRFHLNNCAQDESRLSEWLGHEVFTTAGLPAPRVGHARVALDGKELGLYVLREAFDGQFLRRTFGHTNGNLYDGGFCQDIDSELEKDSGDGPGDRSDLRALHRLCEGVDRDRAQALARALDVDAFLDFVALEAMLGHWDGYSGNRNNFRLWCDARTGRASFLPHGMDQLLGDTEASVLAHPPAIAASAVLQQPAFRKRYRERLKALVPLFDPDRLGPRIEAKCRQLGKAMAADRDFARRLEETTQDLVARVRARHENLLEQVRAPEPKPLQLAANKPFALKKWHPAPETDDVALGKKPFDGVPCLQVACTSRGEEPRQGAWRTSVLLGKGRYRLLGRARCSDVEPPPKDADGNEHGGAVLRAGDATSERLSGDADWRALVCEFEIGEFQRDVELSLDLRALHGKVWFRLDSLQLVRLPE